MGGDEAYVGGGVQFDLERELLCVVGVDLSVAAAEPDGPRDHHAEPESEGPQPEQSLQGPTVRPNQQAELKLLHGAEEKEEPPPEDQHQEVLQQLLHHQTPLRQPLPRLRPLRQTLRPPLHLRQQLHR